MLMCECERNKSNSVNAVTTDVHVNIISTFCPIWAFCIGGGGVVRGLRLVDVVFRGHASMAFLFIHTDIKIKYLK